MGCRPANAADAAESIESRTPSVAAYFRLVVEGRLGGDSRHGERLGVSPKISER